MVNHFLKDDDPRTDSQEQETYRITAREKQEIETTETINKEEILNWIKKLKKKVTPGLDGIENELLKAAGDILAPVLAELFTTCLWHGIFPTEWKKANLVPIPKGNGKGKGDPAGYRPICLLPAISKLMERVVRTRIVENSDLHPAQYGFREGKNTTDALERVIKECKETKDKLALVIMIDIQSAFDNLWWPHVLTALRTQGCPEEIRQVIADYFRDRQVIIRDATRIKEKEQKRGCLQGSVLGPTLWNMAFDEGIRKVATETEGIPIAYADDLAIIVKGETKEEIKQKAERCLEVIHKWCTTKKMEISANKTCTLLGKGNQKGAQAIEVQTPWGKTLQPQRTARYLGIRLAKGMRFLNHCEEISEKAKAYFHRYRAVARAKWGLQYTELKIIYKAVFLPVITYGAAAWAKHATKRDWTKLERAQRAALLTVVRAYKTVSTPALLAICDANPVKMEAQKIQLVQAIRNNNSTTINGIEYNPGKESAKELKEKLEQR